MDQLDGFTLFRAASLDSIEGLPPRRIPLMDSVRDRANSPSLPTFGRQSPTARNLQDTTKVKSALPPSNLGKKDPRWSAGNQEEKRSSMPIIVSTDGDVLTDFVPIARPRPVRVQLQSNEQARVTLHYDGLRAPTLMLRFSALQMPSPGTMLAGLKNVTPTDTEPATPLESVTAESGTVESVRKDVLKRRAMSAYAQPIPNPFDDADTQSLQPLRRRRADTQVQRRATVVFDPIADVRALANKFPSPPDDSVVHAGENVTLKPEQGSQSGHDEDGRPLSLDRSSSGNSKQSSRRSNSARRKPVPTASPLVAESVTGMAPLPTRPLPIPNTSIDDQRTRQRSRMNWTPNDGPSGTGAAIRAKRSIASNSISTVAQTMGTSMALSTSPTGMSFRDAIDSVYDPGYDVPLSEDRPVGRMTDRALQMESYLDMEKERKSFPPPYSDVTTPGAIKDRKIWEQEQEQTVTSPGVVARRRPQGNINTEFPWAQKEDPVIGASVDLEAAWKTATKTARTHDGVGHTGGEDHTVGQVKSLNRVTSRRQPVVRPVAHSVLSISVEEQEESGADDISIGDQWSFVDPYASVVPAGMRGMSVPEEPDSPVDRWQPNPYIRP